MEGYWDIDVNDTEFQLLADEGETISALRSPPAPGGFSFPSWSPRNLTLPYAS